MKQEPEKDREHEAKDQQAYLEQMRIKDQGWRDPINVVDHQAYLGQLHKGNQMRKDNKCRKLMVIRTGDSNQRL